jgi:predicted alpha/beta hydrolase family esterase
MSTSSVDSPVVLVIVPGVGDSGPAHWQSLLQASRTGARRAIQHDWDSPIREQWVETLAETLAGIDAPVVLVGHSAGSVTIVHWAAADARAHRIRGALLVAPADLETELPDGTPVDFLEDAGWVPCPRVPLPFPSIVVASTNDPYATIARSREMAAAWGSRLVTLENAGHINADAGFGAWPLADVLVGELVKGDA